MRVAVIGGGISGRALASLLRRDTSAKVRVFERDAGPPRDRGLGIWPRARRILESLGASPAAAARIPAAAYRSRDGAWLAKSSAGVAADGRVLSTTLRALAAALDVPVEHGTALVSLDAQAGRCTLRRGDGAPFDAEFDLVVGADGPRSLVRRTIAGGAVHGADDGVWRCVSGFADLRVDEPFETLGRGRRFACVPLAGDACYWFATFRRGDAGGSVGEDLVRLYPRAEWHEPVATIAERAAASALLVEDIFAGAPVWSAGRAVCVGDANCALPPNLAQGASAGIEGAAALAAALAAEQDVGAALKRYAAVHSPRVERCARVTAFTEIVAAPESDAVERLRNLARFVPRPLAAAAFDVSLCYSLGWTDAF
ncbi:hypothetical protein M885DRAFT_577380 [Pelagophyceae sp. CCMP2097]|nr:hypothetical protein M885DRAFT_577380 [Pelagophyceae sp. CCMP2097]